jgi:hypothetical protein
VGQSTHRRNLVANMKRPKLPELDLIGSVKPPTRNLGLKNYILVEYMDEPKGSIAVMSDISRKNAQFMVPYAIAVLEKLHKLAYDEDKVKLKELRKATCSTANKTPWKVTP